MSSRRLRGSVRDRVPRNSARSDGSASETCAYHLPGIGRWTNWRRPRPDFESTVRRCYSSSFQPWALMQCWRSTPTRAMPTGGNVPAADAGPGSVHASRADRLADGSGVGTNTRYLRLLPEIQISPRRSCEVWRQLMNCQEEVLWRLQSRSITRMTSYVARARLNSSRAFAAQDGPRNASGGESTSSARRRLALHCPDPYPRTTHASAIAASPSRAIRTKRGPAREAMSCSTSSRNAESSASAGHEESGKGHPASGGSQ